MYTETRSLKLAPGYPPEVGTPANSTPPTAPLLSAYTLGDLTRVLTVENKRNLIEIHAL